MKRIKIILLLIMAIVAVILSFIGVVLGYMYEVIRIGFGAGIASADEQSDRARKGYRWKSN